jgi:hypothetical protein
MEMMDTAHIHIIARRPYLIDSSALQCYDSSYCTMEERNHLSPSPVSTSLEQATRISQTPKTPPMSACSKSTLQCSPFRQSAILCLYPCRPITTRLYRFRSNQLEDPAMATDWSITHSPTPRYLSIQWFMSLFSVRASFLKLGLRSQSMGVVSQCALGKADEARQRYKYDSNSS